MKSVRYQVLKHAVDQMRSPLTHMKRHVLSQVHEPVCNQIDIQVKEFVRYVLWERYPLPVGACRLSNGEIQE